jgi:hypothetical protein
MPGQLLLHSKGKPQTNQLRPALLQEKIGTKLFKDTAASTLKVLLQAAALLHNTYAHMYTPTASLLAPHVMCNTIEITLTTSQTQSQHWRLLQMKHTWLPRRAHKSSQ